MALACVAFGCSNGDGGGDGPGPNGGSCVFAVTLSGATTASYTSSDAFTCSAANDTGGDPIIVFYPEHGMLMRFDLELESEVIGMTGMLEGKFTVITDSGFVWSGDCTYAISRWEGTVQHKIAGTATCEPLEPESGTMTLTAASLAFDMF
jgi:hypothetical protein